MSLCKSEECLFHIYSVKVKVSRGSCRYFHPLSPKLQVELFYAYKLLRSFLAGSFSRDQCKGVPSSSDPSTSSESESSQAQAVSMQDVTSLSDEIKTFRACKLEELHSKKESGEEQEEPHDVHSFEASLLNCFGLNTLYVVRAEWHLSTSADSASILLLVVFGAALLAPEAAVAQDAAEEDPRGHRVLAQQSAGRHRIQRVRRV